ncbi:hypothetical protein [Falsibacillus albus]|uniref:Uncharacterized protein n=1 Tax=Falsibacillus albus TaxID=2478915 RepID=A0A3L7JSC8_9BACI|nr:hypothetical protein [Falsibacillus albus]RLQ93758.1 hypothetical protein D9X91_15905 [Falsibacillus albus]
MRRRKTFISILIAALVLYGLLIIDSANKEARKIELEKKVIGYIQKHEHNGQLHINFSKDLNLSFDKVYIFPPYTPEKEIKQHLGPRSQDLKPYGIHYRDDISLLVFVQNQEIKNVVELPSKYEVTHPGKPHQPYLIPSTVQINVAT